MTQESKTHDLRSKVAQINKILREGEPENVQTEMHSGLTFTGYVPQAVIDALNAVIPDWNMSVEMIGLEREGQAWQATARVAVTIEDLTRIAFGGGVSPGSRGDALKSATTDALKKALSLFSIGNRAYWGHLEAPEGAISRKANGGAEENSVPATKRQREYLDSLVKSLTPDFQRKHIVRLREIKAQIGRGITKTEANEAISWLLKQGIQPQPQQES